MSSPQKRPNPKSIRMPTFEVRVAWESRLWRLKNEWDNEFRELIGLQLHSPLPGWLRVRLVLLWLQVNLRISWL